MRRRLAAVLLACLVVPALALAAETDPKRRINAADEKKAAAIVLKRTDFAAGWKKTPAVADDEDLSCPYYRPNVSDLTLTGDATADFDAAGGIQSVQSYADVYGSSADASASWTRTIKVAMARCFGDFFKRQAATDPDVEVSAVSYAKLAFPRVAPRTAAFRIGLTVTYTESGTSVPLAVHLVVLGRGRAEVGLAAIAPKPGVGAADLRAFAKLLADRMKAAGF